MLDTFFTSKVRVKLLKLFFLAPDKRFHVREITRQIGEEINAVRRELSRLYKIKLLGKETRGNRLYYFLKPNFIFYDELSRMILKEFGLGGDLIKKEKELGHVRYAALSLSIFRREAKEHDGVDLILVGDVSLKVLGQLVSEYEQLMEREINYAVLKNDEYESMKQFNNSFLQKFLDHEVIVLMGDPHKFLGR